MKLTARQVNLFNRFKLPAAFLTGVRAKTLDDQQCVVTVKYRWINQNPFKSMFWAVQGMAAELSTGALVMGKIRESRQKISMLVLNNKGSFMKKAVGRIHFTCEDGLKIDRALTEAIETGEGRTVWLRSVGKDEAGNVVSEFEFEWTLKIKN